MNKITKKILAAAILAILIVISRLIFAEADNVFYSVDPAHFALAAQAYSIQEDRPHLPGYYLHIKVIRLVDGFTHNSHTSMLFLSIFYSALAGVILTFLFSRWFSIKESFLLTLLLVLNPLVWLFGCVTENYSFDLFFSTLLVLVGTKGRWIYLTPFIMALAGGIRQSSPILLLPLYIYLWYRLIKIDKGRLFIALALTMAGIILSFSWLVPMFASVDGLSGYLRLYKTNNPLPQFNFFKNFISFFSYTLYLIIPIIIVLLSILFRPLFKGLSKNNKIEAYAEKEVNIKTKKILILCIWWLIPPILFFLFGHYAKGYWLICVSALFALIGLFLKKRNISFYYLVPAIIVQVLVFLFMPYIHPGDQVYINPKMRTVSQFEVWKERMLSSYSMSRSQIEYLNHEKQVIDNNINKIKSFMDKSNKKMILVDQSTGISPGILQTRYPELEFTRLDFRMSDSYEVMKGLDEFPMRNLNYMFQNAVVLASKEFFDLHLTEYNEHFEGFNGLIVYTVKPGLENNIKGLYDNYFKK